MVELNFQLNVDDGWPPVSVEGVPCSPVAGGFRVEAPPLFVKNLSVGDVISAAPDAEGRVWEWAHVSKSTRTTIWVGRLKQSAQLHIENLLHSLRTLGCYSSGNEVLGCYAVDVPSTCAIENVDKLTERADQKGIAIAYPSFRHEELSLIHI